ncbi:sensor histidine kinase [Saccharopolyspora erythraea]|uniref:sensor histidine kinase n=1 Tax=Saccharopolyspora erythraea TaxID=1836 RepID=UPI001EE655C0|nr:sensor histidine kinase [Saccharopolyspora erythraea]
MRVTGGERFAEVTVTDDGPGVPAGERERVFDRWVRLDQSRSGGGAGLGLPVARGIARAHGGDLSCVEHSGDGAVFRLTLPR